MKNLILPPAMRLLAACFALCCSAQADTFTVTNTNPTGAGSLSQAVADAAALAGPDTLLFDPNLSGQTITLISGEISLDSALTIDATALAAGLTISGNNASRIFNIGASGNVTLVGLTLTDGLASQGAAIYTSGTLTLTHCTLSGNHCPLPIFNTLHGGAIHNSGTLTLTHCTLSGNSAPSGGGGAIYNSGTLTLTQCTLSGNSTVQGGAIRNFLGTLTLTQCTLSGNSAYYGGAIQIDYGTLTLTQCTLSGNSAYYGGAIYIDSGTLTLTQCTLSGNSAVYDGGAIQSNGTLALTNSIVAGNSVTDGGLGADISNYGGTTTRTGKNIIQSLANIEGGTDTGTDSINADPLLAPLGNYGGLTQTMPPLMGSPAIDAGANTALSTDQRGFPRVVGSAVDIGAVEISTALVTTPADGNPGSLRYAVESISPAGISEITFAPALDGQTITLSSEIVPNTDVTIDASSLPAGIILSGGNTNRIFSIPGGKTVTLKRLTLTGGIKAAGYGGAIYNSGMLTLTQCTLFGNHGSIYGGAIWNTGTLQLTQCTLSGNSAVGGGGGIFNDFGTLQLTHCTLSGNSADSGGALFNNAYGDDEGLNSGPLTPDNCIVADNTAATSDPNIWGPYTLVGANIIDTAAHLAPLGDYGGSTQTMALLPGSPARDAAFSANNPPIAMDSRGFAVVGTPDIGAYEAGTFNSFATWAWESAGSALTFGSDDEQDGAPNGLEYATRRNPSVSDTPLSPTLAPAVPSGHTFEFRYQKNARDLRYIVQRSSDLGPANSWMEVYRYDSSTSQITGTGVTSIKDATNQLITLTDSATGPSLFWRLVTEQVE